MKKVLIMILCAVLCISCFAACGKEEEIEEETVPNDVEIVGTWKESYWDSGYTFNEDGTGSDIFWDEEFTYTAIEGDLVLTFTSGLYKDKVFTYTISGNTLTLTKVITDPETESEGTWEYTKVE